MTRLLSLSLALVLLAACDEPLISKPAAVGATPEILVVTDSTTWNGTVGEAVRATLAKPISTLPNKQGFLALRFQQLDPSLLDGIRRQKNVLFIAPITAQTSIGDYLRARIPEGQQGALRSGRSVAVTTRDDLWAIGQVVVTATAANDSLLAQAILDRGDSLRAAYNRNVIAWTRTEMFERARQTEIEDELMAEHGWAVAIQHDYLEVQDTTATAAGRTGMFTRFRRIVPETWRDFFVFAQDGVTELPSEAETDRITNDLLRQFAVGQIDSTYIQLDPRRPITTDTTQIGGRTTRETRGLWQMIGYPMGGSYIRYTFLDPETDRLYIYYGMVFSPVPRYDKREFLRQMEIIGTTFRTREDEAHAAASSG